jgi:predicted TIM-barrel fold metal-dependent hydrolase
MPFGGNDWHSLRQEETLEPEIPICDPHHHFWDYRTERIPYHRYLLHELADDVNSGHNVTSTVFVEARSMYRTIGPEEMRPVGEVEFVQGIAAQSASGMYSMTKAAHGIVGHANLHLGTEVRRVLEALQAASPNRFKGIRHGVSWDPHPEIPIVGAYPMPDQLMGDDYRAGARVLAEMGLSLDVSLLHPQLPQLVDFANAVPDLTIVLNHVGGLMRTGPYASNPDEVMANWRSGIAAAAECPNVVIKLGGVGMPRLGYDFHERETPVGSEDLAAAIDPVMRHCIEQFGPSRCMFESNFPVDKVSYSYTVMYNAFKRLTTQYSAPERADMFHDVAARVYSVEY